jgi:hypothetical protein
VTTDELKRFVDQKVPAPPPKPPAKPDAGTDTEQNAADTGPDPAAQLRDLLARRLVRDGRVAEALPYFVDPATRKIAGDYRAALAAAAGAWSPVTRAQGWHTAALIARNSGMEIMGTESTPDFASGGGSLDVGIGQAKKPEGEFMTPAEAKRFDDSAAQPDERFHYRYIAAADEEKAADLLPPRSQAFAAVLCTATGWMEETGHVGWEPQKAALDRMAALYARYVKDGAHVPWAAKFGHDCQDPDFDTASAFWWTHAPGDTRRWASRNRWGVGAALVLAIGAAGTAIVLRRRRKTAA